MDCFAQLKITNNQRDTRVLIVYRFHTVEYSLHNMRYTFKLGDLFPSTSENQGHAQGRLYWQLIALHAETLANASMRLLFFTPCLHMMS